MQQARRYQSGTLEKKSTVEGICWYIRFTYPDGSRPRTRIGLVANLPTRTLARKAAADLVKAFNEAPLIEPPRYTMADAIHRYIREELPARHDTGRGYKSYLNGHIMPKWGTLRVEDVKPKDVRAWLDKLELAPKSKSHILGLMRQLFRYAMLWEWIPLSENPMNLFRLKGGNRRKAKPRVLSTADFLKLVAQVNREPHSTMMLLAGCLGLSCSELTALRWCDIDWKEREVKIERGIVNGRVDDVKTEKRGASLPLHQLLIERLKALFEASEYQEDDDWIFASPFSAGEKPFHAYRIQQYVIAPAAVSCGLGEKIGWHTFRHSYRSWLSKQGAPVGVQKDLLRHADIRTTMNIYGDSFMDDLRKANKGVVEVILQ